MTLKEKPEPSEQPKTLPIPGRREPPPEAPPPSPGPMRINPPDPWPEPGKKRAPK